MTGYGADLVGVRSSCNVEAASGRVGTGLPNGCAPLRVSAGANTPARYALRSQSPLASRSPVNQDRRLAPMLPQKSALTPWMGSQCVAGPVWTAAGVTAIRMPYLRYTVLGAGNGGNCRLQRIGYSSESERLPHEYSRRTMKRQPQRPDTGLASRGRSGLTAPCTGDLRRLVRGSRARAGETLARPRSTPPIGYLLVVCDNHHVHLIGSVGLVEMVTTTLATDRKDETWKTLLVRLVLEQPQRLIDIVEWSFWGRCHQIRTTKSRDKRQSHVRLSF